MSEQNTLRTSIEAAFEQHDEVTPPDIPAVVNTEETASEAADRARDEKGRFAPKAEKPAEVPVEVQPAEIPQEITRPQRPQSWKKDYWDHWETLDPKLAEYLLQREQEFAKGVSTYKSEWDRAKPVLDAIAPFQPLLQQYKIDPGEWVQNLGKAHYKLFFGSPQEKLEMLGQLAHEYGINVQALAGMQGVPTTFPTKHEINGLVREQFEQAQAQQALEQFQKEVPTKYPHFEQVKDRMAGLLQAGQANDLPDAYEKALRLDNDLFESLQESKLREEIEKRQKAAQQAKANAVSPRSATPADTNGNAAKPKDRRSQIASAFDEMESKV